MKRLFGLHGSCVFVILYECYSLNWNKTKRIFQPKHIKKFACSSINYSWATPKASKQKRTKRKRDSKEYHCCENTKNVFDTKNKEHHWIKKKVL